MYKVSGELDFDVRSGVANARLAARELENVGTRAKRSSVNIDTFAKRIFGARTASEYLAKTLARLGPSLIGGAVGGTALGAIVSSAKNAKEELDKLAESLDKAVGAKAGASIGDTLSKINGLTTAIEESATKISKQSPLATVASFFMNEDADRAAQSFAKAVEERIALGNKLVEQTAEQNAQNEISSSLEGKLGEIYKINLNYRKELSKIDDIEGITKAQKSQLRALAEQARATQTRLVLTKELADADKKASEEKKKSDEDFARTSFNILDSLQKQEEALFEKNANAYKQALQEQIKAKQEAENLKIQATRNAINEIDRLDQVESEEKSRFRTILEKTGGGRAALKLAESRAAFLRRQETPRAERAALTEFAQDRGIDITKPGFQFQDLRKMMAQEATGLKKIPTIRGVSPKEDSQKELLNVLKSIDKKLPAAVPQ